MTKTDEDIPVIETTKYPKRKKYALRRVSRKKGKKRPRKKRPRGR